MNMYEHSIRRGGEGCIPNVRGYRSCERWQMPKSFTNSELPPNSGSPSVTRRATDKKLSLEFGSIARRTCISKGQPALQQHDKLCKH
jgi:hypothetical protein